MEQLRPRILAVDDDPDIRTLLAALLSRDGYEIETASNGDEALEKLEAGFDLVISDLNMPGMNGHEVTRRIRDNDRWRDIPVVMITSEDTKQERLQAVESGANDFIAKPVSAIELQVRIRAQLKLKQAMDLIRNNEAELELHVAERTAALRKAIDEVSRRERELQESHIDTLHRLAIAAEFKDTGTAEHIGRMGRYAELLYRALGCTTEECEIMLHAAPMHDIGKIGIPDAILLKPGHLNGEEWTVMKQHTVIGARILEKSRTPHLQIGETVAISHHEKWDGSGYPKGLREDAIPLAGRVCAVADVYDSLLSRRAYKAAYSVENSLAIMRECRGQHFDPRVLDAFMDHHDQVEEIRKSANVVK
jgi:putative two-component system response regulator